MRTKPTKAGINRAVGRAHKGAETILDKYPKAAPYSRITAKSICMLGWLDGYRTAIRDNRRDLAEVRKLFK